MKKRIHAMAEGKFDYKEIDVQVSQQRIELMAKKNEVLKGSFTLESNDERKLKGLIYTSNRRMKCEDVQFIGKKVQILYEFHTVGMEEGETNKGEIYIESNAGEIIVPYVVSVSLYAVDSSIGKIKNLFHFANLAQQNYQEAYKLFCSKKFRRIHMEEEQLALYEALTAGNICRESMEEFLIAVHKKQPIRFILSTSEKSYEYEGDSFKKDVTLSKNTWGYFSIKISADVDFIRIEKTEVTSEDFVGNHYNLEFIVDKKKLHAGKNYGVITFSTGIQTEILKVEIGMPGEENKERRQEKGLLCEIIRNYIQVRSHKVRDAVWIKETLSMAELLGGLRPEKPGYKLLQAQMYAMAKRETEGFFLMNQFKDLPKLRKQEPEIYAYYQYVMALLRRDEDFTKLVNRELVEMSDTYPQSYRILALRLFLDADLESSGLSKYRMLKQQFTTYGCRSPFLYLEACLLIQKDSSLFNRLEAFEMHVLSFAEKYGLFNEEMVQKTADMALRLREFEGLVFRFLKKAYEEFPLESCVEAICSMLIRANRRNKNNFPWFERGVKADLKLTQLFEYYLYTCPQDGDDVLPKTLFMYFNFDNMLDYKRKAFLYANIWKHRESMSDLFSNYEPRIKLFVIEQVMQKRIDWNLAYLYRQMSGDILLDEEASATFEEMVFVQELTCKNTNIRQVVVRHKELEREEIFPLVDGRAWVKRYYGDALLLLEDKQGRRHVDTVDYECRPLFQLGDIARYCMKFQKVRLGLLLNRYNKTTRIWKEGHSAVCEKLLAKSELCEECRQQITRQLIEYYMQERQYEKAESYLEKLQFGRMEASVRAYFLEMMINRGMYRRAYEIILVYGTERITPRYLVRMCSRLIDMDEVKEELLDLCYDVFSRGKYDEAVLEYLTRYFYGPTWQMHRVWCAAKNFEIETYQIGERILVQMLFTGYLLPDSGEIFQDYYQPGFKAEVIQAYLAFFAYYYVVHDQIIDERVLKWIEQACRAGDRVNQDCHAALLKYYAEMPDIPMEKVEFLQTLMAEFVDKNMMFPFFARLDPKVTGKFHMGEKTIVEHRAPDDRRVVLAYRMSNQGYVSEEYKKEEMTRIYNSIYVKELITFYGEKVQYYIIEMDENGAGEEIVTSAILDNQQQDETDTGGRFGLLNEISISYSLEDEESLQTLMEKYGQTESLAEALFELQE